MMAPPSWQGSNFEGPAIVYHPVSDGRAPYFLFYGANAWDSAAAGIGYATCESPLGPCTNQSVSGPWLASRGRRSIRCRNNASGDGRAVGQL